MFRLSTFLAETAAWTKADSTPPIPVAGLQMVSGLIGDKRLDLAVALLLVPSKNRRDSFGCTPHRLGWDRSIPPGRRPPEQDIDQMLRMLVLGRVTEVRELDLGIVSQQWRRILVFRKTVSRKGCFLSRQ